MKTLSRIIASFFGIGYFPIAPGTVSSFIIILLYKYLIYSWSWPVYAAFGLLIFAAGIWTASITEAEASRKDPRFIVIDEILGQWIALFLLPPAWPAVLAAFFLFRLFDIIKPFWIRRAETFPGGWGIMLDDILAGMYAGILINLYLIII
ncbi:MAG: phosphatidylglycerophosphatase A [Candidatus Aminicenantes bacterium]